ncbi:helix-turn-helix domain-containing protein, partial [Ideonella azotifigens]
MDIKRSELPLLISLDALLAELNVTRAARRLNISQSALSGQLARLREAFGDPLLVPSETGRGMVPTERALELKPRL